MGLFSTSDRTRFKKLKEEGCVVTLQVEVPAPKVKEAYDNILVRLQGQARLPGFRPGKAPLDVVKRQLDGLARERVVDQLLRDILPDALKEHQLHPVSTPAVHSISYEPGKPLSFHLVVETPPRFEPKSYKKLQVKKDRHEPTEEDLAKRLEELREGNARLETAKEDAAAKNHYLVIDYEGFAEGKPLKGAKGQDELVDLSTPNKPEGLVEGLLGAKRGETREVPVTVQDKPAVFKVQVKEIKTKVLPAADDELAKDLGYDSLLALRGALRQVLEDEAKRKGEREVTLQIEQGLLKANNFPVPPSLVEDSLLRMMERLRREVLGPRRDWPDAEKEKLQAQLRPKAEEELRLSYLLRAVAEAEKLKVTDEDLKGEMDKSLEAAQSDDEKSKIRRFFEERKDALSVVVLERKVLDFLKSSASVTEA